jgi:hypothetical protein
VNAHRVVGVDMAVPGSERTVVVLTARGAGLSDAAVVALQQMRRDHGPRVLVVRDGAGEVRLSPKFLDELAGMEPVAISREEIMDAVQTPPALVQHAPARAGKGIKLRAAQFSALAAAIANGVITVGVGGGMQHKHRPNWLKQCLISRRKGWG